MQIITHTEPWVLASLGTMYIVLLSIITSSLCDFFTGKRRDRIRQEIFFDKYMDIINFTESAGPLIGLFSTNSLGSYALLKAGPVLSGGSNGSSQMGEMFNSIAQAMSATSLGIGVALLGFAVSLVCRWIYDIEPVAEYNTAVKNDPVKSVSFISTQSMGASNPKVNPESKETSCPKAATDSVKDGKYKGINLSKDE